jgi:putative metallopeptidase DUF4344
VARLATLLFALGVALGAGACQTREAREPPAPPAPDLPVGGRFIAEYGPATAEFEDFRAGLVANRFLDTIASRLNDSLRIPKDVTLATAHCDEPNASYQPEKRQVILCYELFRALSERFDNEVGGDYLVTGTLVFALMHELGHGLIDVLELPTTGREEDAVDQLATILLLNQGAIGDSLAFGAVGWFATNAQSSQLDDLALADDHGLDKQRVYNIICWIYGRNPKRYPEVLAEGWLPEHRAERCPAEYLRLRKSWDQLLAPYRRGPP